MSTFTARVSFDPINYDWVEILAVKTKSVLTLDMADRTPSEFTGLEKVLWKEITEGKIENGKQVALTVEEGKAFKAMCARNRGTAEVEDNRTAARMADVIRPPVFGLGKDELERRLNSLKEFKRASTKRFRGVSYDIPVKLLSTCPYPRKKWERKGAWFSQDSHAVVEESRLNDDVYTSEFRKWKRHGVNYDVFPAYDPTENSVLRKIAAREHHKFLVECHTSLISGIIRFDEKLEKALKASKECEIPLTEKEVGHLITDRHSKVRLAIRDATLDLEAAVRFAEEYELREMEDDLLEGLRVIIRTQALQFNEQARNDGVKQVAVP